MDDRPAAQARPPRPRGPGARSAPAQQPLTLAGPRAAAAAAPTAQHATNHLPQQPQLPQLPQQTRPQPQQPHQRASNGEGGGQPVVAPYWHIAAVRLRSFKSFSAARFSQVQLPSCRFVGILGANGSGKSNLMEAIMFAAGCPATALRVRTLRELASSDAADAVREVVWSKGAVEGVELSWIRGWCLGPWGGARAVPVCVGRWCGHWLGAV